MKVLVATARTQGVRPNDYHHCIEGELVWISLVCGWDQDNPDGGCGCGRAFAGLNSHRATTTAVVTDLPDLSRDDYILAIKSSLVEQGFPGSAAREIADLQLALAESFPAGAVVERRLDEIRQRAPLVPDLPDGTKPS